MDIKRIHEMIETLTEVAKCEFDKGIENIDTKEMGEVADMIKDLSEAMYYRTITVAMEDSEYGVDYDYMGAYDEHSRKGYRGQPKDSKGRYMSRRSYESRIMPEMDYDKMERMRDLDRETKNKMYYTDSYSRNNTGSMNNSSSQSNGMEGRSGMARRGYIESKETHKDNSSESKQAKMKELENYMKSMAEDLTEAIEGASPEERAMAKNKLSVLVQKM